ncbi:hypothetical protein GOP47_0028899 [Adiantum capillus-veneris]|nr:hypothetical protein GOP47_0028899 [Adiantum capillus-veneris]
MVRLKSEARAIANSQPSNVSKKQKSVDVECDWFLSRRKDRESPTVPVVDDTEMDVYARDSQLGDEYIPLVHEIGVTTVA